MALEIELAEASGSPTRKRQGRGHTLVIGLVNNMPDSALEATETQFGALLGHAAGDLAVRLRFTSIPEVPRSPEAAEHIEGTYWPLEALLHEAPDALIITGTEPIAASLCEEPYWGTFLKLLRWTEANTVSSVWSCLAAHGAVQALDGIQRQRLGTKRFGVFEHGIEASHSLLAGISAPLQMPHSRWNDLPMPRLRAAGYEILTEGASGADLFVKQNRSLLVFFQGHPEYETATLLKEYRRDIGRYLRAQQQHYPPLPANYFSRRAEDAYTSFQQRATKQRTPELLSEFPAAAVTDLASGWQVAAARIYHNWLSHVSTLKDRAQRKAT